MPADTIDAPTVRAALARMGLCPPDAEIAVTPLAGGVSSDIVRVDGCASALCVKRALPKLRVAADWQAPVERNRYEVAWLRVAGQVVPEAVPAVLGDDAEAGLFAMDYLDPGAHPVWKNLLRDGVTDPSTAMAVGSRLAAIHDATAGDAVIAASFATDHIFRSIRLEPYLVATALRHPDCARALHALVEETAGTRVALVHGDVSPKNILVGPAGPVFIDAECAWYGDPAFDLAFCLNHLLLKCVWRPASREGYLAGFDALARDYLRAVTWERRDALESRAARLVPGLLLGRVDGKSPVEYLTDEADRNRVRAVARTLLLDPVDSLADLVRAWRRALYGDH